MSSKISCTLSLSKNQFVVYTIVLGQTGFLPGPLVNQRGFYNREENRQMYDITIIGAAIIDILASPISRENLTARSYPAECITMAPGGDGANEATTLAHLGKRVNLITKLGDDLTGKMLLNHFQENGVSLEDSVIE